MESLVENLKAQHQMWTDTEYKERALDGKWTKHNRKEMKFEKKKLAVFVEDCLKDQSESTV